MTNIATDTTTYPGFIGAAVVPARFNNFITDVCKICNKKEIRYDVELSTRNPRHIYPSGTINLDCADKLNNYIQNAVSRSPEIIEGVFNQRQRAYVTRGDSWHCPCLPLECIFTMLAGDLYFNETWTKAKVTLIFSPRNSMLYVSDTIPVEKLHDDFDLDVLDNGWDNEDGEFELFDDDIIEATFIASPSCLARVASLNSTAFTWSSMKAFDLVAAVAKKFISKEQITKIII
jgi:hypothetical protein